MAITRNKLSEQWCGLFAMLSINRERYSENHDLFLYEDIIHAGSVCGQYSGNLDTFFGLITKINHFIIVFTLLWYNTKKLPTKSQLVRLSVWRPAAPGSFKQILVENC